MVERGRLTKSFGNKATNALKEGNVTARYKTAIKVFRRGK